MRSRQILHVDHRCMGTKTLLPSVEIVVGDDEERNIQRSHWREDS